MYVWVCIIFNQAGFVILFSIYFGPWYAKSSQTDGLVQELCNSIASAMELTLSYSKPLI